MGSLTRSRRIDELVTLFSVLRVVRATRMEPKGREGGGEGLERDISAATAEDSGDEDLVSPLL